MSLPSTGDLAADVSLQGHYAGAVTRAVAFGVDQTVATIIYALATALVAWLVDLVVSPEVTIDPQVGVAAGFFVVWLFVYYAYPWSVSGKTLGMAVLGIRVVQRDGSPTTPRNGIIRTLVLPLTFLTLGIGFLPIIFGRERRAMHDAAADTAVVYDWDARAARLRFLARQGTAGRRNSPTIAP